MQHSKKKYWENYCAGLNFNSKTGNVWKTLSKLKGKGTYQNFNFASSDGSIVDMQTLSENFAKIFKEVSSDKGIDKDITESRKNTVEQFLNSCPFDGGEVNFQENQDRKLINEDFKMNELESVLKMVNKKSAPGADDIPYSFLINSPYNSKMYLLQFFNLSWAQGMIPNKLKHSIIKPILKPNKNKSDISSYRPISLTSTLSKIMEKIIANRLSWYLEKNNLLNPNQAGFRKKFSTADPIIRLKHEIDVALNAGCFTVAVMIDFKRAFDLLWIDGLILKLIKLKISGNFLKWIKCFLTNRTYQVRVKNSLSSCYSTENGTPQGSALSPLLFLIMINDFPKLSDFTSNAFFADDSTIWRSGKNLAHIFFHLQQDLDIIYSWCKRWGFIINLDKTSAIVFSKTGTKIQNFILKIDNNIIKTVKNVTLLGVTFDSHMTLTSHVESMIVKAKNNLNLMRCVSGFDLRARKGILLTLYKALIRSLLDYCCFDYTDCSKTLKKKIDTIQYKSLLIAVGGIKGTALNALLGECEEMPLELRRKELLLKYLFKLYYSKNDAAYCVLQDKKIFSLEINSKSKYRTLLNYFLKDSEIELGNNVYEYKSTPWMTFDNQIDTELLVSLTSCKENQKTSENYVLSKFQWISQNFIHIFLVDGSVTIDGRVGAAFSSYPY